MNLSQILKDFEMNVEQFVDLCILLGCDYISTIRGIGPRKAFELIKKHKCIENVLETIDQTVCNILFTHVLKSYSHYFLHSWYIEEYFQKYPVPENWQYREARRLFLEPDVMDCENLEVNQNVI